MEDIRLIVVDLGERCRCAQPTIHLHWQGSGNTITGRWVLVSVCEVGTEGVLSILLLINAEFCRHVCFGMCSDGREVVFFTMAELNQEGLEKVPPDCVNTIKLDISPLLKQQQHKSKHTLKTFILLPISFNTFK